MQSMHYPYNVRGEQGAALVISLLILAVLLLVGSGSITTSKIETQIASNDTKSKQALLGAEYALSLGESTVEQAAGESDLTDRLTALKGRLYGRQQQPAWDNCVWDDRDSFEVSTYFTDAGNPSLPPLPPTFQDPHARPRLMVESKYTEYDNLTIGKGIKTGVSYFNISAHGARAKWTPTEKPGATTTPPITYNDRYPGTRVVLQSIYAKRYN